MSPQEINEQIAKRLGWKTFASYPANDPLDFTMHWVGPNGGLSKPLPNFCGDIGAAWEIVEQAELWCVITKSLRREFGAPESSISAVYECEIWKNHDEPNLRVEADTASMAIALAFLKLGDK